MILIIIFLIDKLLKIFLLLSDSYFLINKGIFLGLLINPVAQLIIIIFLVLIIVYYKKNVFSEFSIKIIALGSIMNISDRFIWGGVFDYFNLFGVLYFNIADVIILIGIIYLVYSRYFSDKKNIFKS